jgi:hypothetical protein
MSTAHQALDAFCSWLKVTPFSILLQTVTWIVPAVQSVHILAIAAVVASASMITLRTLGLTGRDEPWSVVASRFLPVILGSLPVLLATGLLLITAEPARSLENPAFFLKMILLVGALGVTAVWHVTTRSKSSTFWESSAPRRRAARVLAVLFLSLWVAIVFAGRWIAYVEAS